MGVAFAIAGAVPWILDAAGIGVYPGALHRSLMIQGFEQSFVLGFLLTALPGFLHAERCAAWELWLAVTLQIAFGIAAFSGATEWAQIAYLSSLALLGSAAVRRIGRSRARPPVEMVFVPFGILCGIAGAALTIAGRAGWIAEPIPGFAGRLLSLGMMLSVVLGMGGLLVPVFAGVRDPLVIPGIAAPQARAGRRVLYGAILVALASAFALEAIGQARLGMALRAAGGVRHGAAGMEGVETIRALDAWGLGAAHRGMAHDVRTLARGRVSPSSSGGSSRHPDRRVRAPHPRRGEPCGDLPRRPRTSRRAQARDAGRRDARGDRDGSARERGNPGRPVRVARKDRCDPWYGRDARRGGRMLVSRVARVERGRPWTSWYASAARSGAWPGAG